MGPLILLGPFKAIGQVISQIVLGPLKTIGTTISKNAGPMGNHQPNISPASLGPSEAIGSEEYCQTVSNVLGGVMVTLKVGTTCPPFGTIYLIFDSLISNGKYSL